MLGSNHKKHLFLILIFMIEFSILFILISLGSLNCNQINTNLSEEGSIRLYKGRDAFEKILIKYDKNYYAILPHSFKNLFKEDPMTSQNHATESPTNTNEIENADTSKIIDTDIDVDIGTSHLIFKEGVWTEYFLFDENRTLIFLNNPEEHLDDNCKDCYFLEIVSPLFFQRFQREWNQIQQGHEAKDKQLSSSPFFKKVGPFQLEVYFTPREFNFSTNSRSSYKYKMKQANLVIKPRPDIWRLLQASSQAAYVGPNFQDEQMLEDFIQSSMKAEKKTLDIYEYKELYKSKYSSF